MSVEAVERAILANPDAKAVLVNNPTYYGVCPDIRRIAKLAHEHGMLLLADEAHGTHFFTLAKISPALLWLPGQIWHLSAFTKPAAV